MKVLWPRVICYVVNLSCCHRVRTLLATCIDRKTRSVLFMRLHARLRAKTQIYEAAHHYGCIYLLEAEQIGRESSPGEFNRGEGLGPVGARIIAETIHGLISLDSRSFLSQQPNWSPADGLGISSVGEILTYGGGTNAHA